MRGIEHQYHHIELEPIDDPPDSVLIKILSLDGRRFTYRFEGELTEDAVDFVKQTIEDGAIQDLWIERVEGKFRFRDPPKVLKKHG